MSAKDANVKVSSEAAEVLVSAVRERGEEAPWEGGVMFQVDDLTVLLDTGGRLFALVVDVLGRELVVGADLQATFEEDEEVMVVEDDDLISFLDTFLTARAALLERTGV